MPAIDDNAALVEALDAGRVQGLQVVAPRIDTHLSHVFFSVRRAFKLKRAVHLPFVDFSSVDARRVACEAELEINRRMGSRLYLGVRPVVDLGGGAYRIGGEGRVVDWVVEMHRFEQSGQFDELAHAGRLSRELIEATADRIAGIHRDLAPVRDTRRATNLAEVIDTLRETEADGRSRHGLEARDGGLFDALHAALANISATLERRREQGKVRRCHGDLHLRNICLFKGELTLFDALEFDDRLATVDVLYDFAFLLMDLRHRGLSRHANAAMNRYWDVACEDESGLATLPLFMALRAAVRMAVAAEAGRGDEADQYRGLACELLARTPPRLIAIGGLSGVGKSAIAKQLAARLPGPAGVRILRTDVLRKRERDAGSIAADGAAVFAPENVRAPPDAYGAHARSRVYSKMRMHAAEALAAGATVIADATFIGDADRASLDSLTPAAVGIWLEASLELRLQRIGRRIGDASDADEAVARAQVEPGAVGPGWNKVDASGSIDDVTDAVLRVLA
ncbi:MAG: AAA family ATPase [Burkholderiaceae bacterium]